MNSKVLHCCSVLTLIAGFSANVAAWTETRNFNGGPIGEKVNLGAGGRSVYDDEHVLEGDRAAKMTALEGDTGFGQWGGVINHPAPLHQGDEIWFRVSFYFPEGFDYYSYGEGGRLKVFRVHMSTPDGAHHGYSDVLIDRPDSPWAWIFGLEGSGQGLSGIGTKKEDLPKFERWETYEWYMKFDPVSKADGGQAIIRFWKNGKLVKEITDKKTMRESTDVADSALLFTYWNGGSPKTQSLWVDDMVLTSDKPAAKDEFGNAYIGMGMMKSRPTFPTKISIRQ